MRYGATLLRLLIDVTGTHLTSRCLVVQRRNVATGIHWLRRLSTAPSQWPFTRLHKTVGSNGVCAFLSDLKASTRTGYVDNENLANFKPSSSYRLPFLTCPFTLGFLIPISGFSRKHDLMNPVVGGAAHNVWQLVNLKAIILPALAVACCGHPPSPCHSINGPQASPARMCQGCQMFRTREK